MLFVALCCSLNVCVGGEEVKISKLYVKELSF